MRSLVLELSSGKWEVGGGGGGRPGAGSAGLLPSSTYGSAQDPPGPRRGDEMRRGSLADSGTIICPLQEKTSWGALRGQNRAESTAQLHLSSLLDPGGNPALGLPGGDFSPLCWLLRAKKKIGPIPKHQTPHKTICLLAQKPWGTQLHPEPLRPRAQCATVSRDKQSSKWQGIESWG